MNRQYLAAAQAAARPAAASSRVIQRKCGCGNSGGGSGQCASCADDEKKLQRRAIGTAQAPEIPQSVDRVLQSPGRPLDRDTRVTMESRFGHDFSRVRIHSDTHAAASAHEIHAAAYTSGTHIVFGDRRFEPGTPRGRHLLAHELAHVVQQRGDSAIPAGIGSHDDAHERAADRTADAIVAHGAAFAPKPVARSGERLIRREGEDAERDPAAVTEALIVDDAATPNAGQMKRSDFVEELDRAVCATSSEEMRRLGQSTDGCPMLEQWRPKIRAMTARQLEVSMRRWINNANNVRTAHDYIPRVQARLADGIRIWGKTGSLAGIPADLMDMLAGGTVRVGVGSLIKGAIGSLFRKAHGATAATAVAFDGGHGRPLDGNTATRMGAAFGRDFGGVRVHTDAGAAAAAARVNARAFTIGNDVAFAAGEYAPGTLIGDALLAHELAHVAQQEGAETVNPKGPGPASAVEDDADTAAVYAVASLWPRLRNFGLRLRQNAMPRLKSSLQLSRCSAKPGELQDYMKDRDRTNAIEDHGDSDDKARQIVEEWSKGDTQYVLTVRRKILLIKEMLSGSFSGSDQEQVLNLLERSESADLKQILGAQGGIPHQTLLSKFDSWKKELWRFYMRRYTKAYPDDVQEKIELGQEPPEPQPPTKLEGVEPSDYNFSVVQQGDPLPETTQPGGVATKQRKDKLGRSEAQALITNVYGSYISDKQTQKVDKTGVRQESSADTKEFEAFLNSCLAKKDTSTPDKKKEATDACRGEESGTAAYYERSSNEINIKSDRESPSTMVHEVMHAYADERAFELAHFAMEGLTELLTRRAIMKDAASKKQPHLFIGGHYDQQYDALQELAIVVGEELLINVHFKGDVTTLCNTLGKAKYDAWNKAMESQGGSQDATNILRGVKPVDPTKEKCK